VFASQKPAAGVSVSKAVSILFTTDAAAGKGQKRNVQKKCDNRQTP